MTSYVQRRYGKIMNEIKQEVSEFDGTKKLNVSVMLVLHCKCGHKDFRYATDDEVLQYKEKILESDKIRTSAREISIDLDSEEICSECKNQEQLRVKYHPDQDIQNMVFSHGLDAFSVDENEKLEHALDHFAGIVNHPEWEICVSEESQPLGNIGIACSGDVSIAATTDVYSYVKHGWRCCDEEYEKYFVQSKKDLVPDPEGFGYIEAWIKVKNIEYVWIKSEYAFKEDAKKYFEGLGYEVRIVA